MPSTRPCAAFEPISPDFDLKTLVETNPNFEWVTRIHCDMIDHHGLDGFDRLVLMHVIMGGKPLVVEGYEGKLDKWIFALQWLRDNCGSKVVDARDLTKQVNLPLSIGHYLKHMALLTNQWTPKNFKDNDRQRMYLKDIDCPDMWHEKMKTHIPPSVFYLNESTGDVGGLGSVDEPNPHGPGTRKGPGVAKAGDLMSSLPKEMRAENLMCYIGHEGTYTPAHREMCASLGQNIMVEASTGSVEDGKPTKPGSSIWFMTETTEREVVSEYWLSRLGHDIEVEKHFAQVNAWKTAPFKVWVVEQKPGDFILIPPLAPHQVWNRGTRTMKIAWNRTTVETLEMALNEALPKARMVCRDEQYKNKAIIYYSLQKYSAKIIHAEKLRQRKPDSKRAEKANNKITQLGKDFKRLHALFTKIMVSESFFPSESAKKVEMVPYEGFITCSYCRCNVFNRFLTCPTCVVDLTEGEKDTYDVCLDCYAMGRSCACISKLRWAEQWDWSQLVHNHDQWRHQIVQMEGGVSEKSPRLLQTELDHLGKRRTLAQICQLELIKRPFKDIRKPEKPVDIHEHLEDDVQVDDDGNVKKKRFKKKSEKFVRDHARCHIDCHWEPKWKQATCTKCDKNYCYGTLFRAYDMMPQDIMANPEWRCPSCLGICNCRHCRNKLGYRKYTPKGTLLGHNTKAVADPRSVESLVDFSFSNIGWIQKAGDDRDAGDTERLRRRRREAEAAMAEHPQLGENYVDTEVAETDVDAGILRLAEQEGIPIDPALATEPQLETPDEDVVNENPEDVAKNTYSDVDSSPFFLPEGGIIQDAEHAYDVNDAVTFVYPEPALLAQLPPPPMEGYQEAVIEAGPNYDEVVPPQTPGTIEMVERKRKRHKFDDGDQPYQHKKSYPKKAAPSKKRQSLVVKLAVPKSRLRDMERVALQAQAASSSVAAPTISSDLQALNVYPDRRTMSEKKRQRLDGEVMEDIDKEYAPSRRRHRQKQIPDETQSSLNADTTRRTTRTHNVRYDEPDEEEFNEVVVSKSKSQFMETFIDNSLEAIHKSDAGTESDLESDQEEITSPTFPKQAASITRISTSSTKTNSKSGPATTLPKDNRLMTAKHTLSPNLSAKTFAEAAANRRAKMAAIEGNDIDAFDDSWSANESLPTPEHLVGNIPDDRATQSSRTVSESPSSQISHTDVARSRSAQVKKHSMSGTSHGTPLTVKSVANIKAISVKKASADDWGQSESSDEDAPKRPNANGGGFSAINVGIGNHTVPQKRIGNHVLTAKSGRGRPRGRPRLRG